MLNFINDDRNDDGNSHNNNNDVNIISEPHLTHTDNLYLGYIETTNDAAVDDARGTLFEFLNLGGLLFSSIPFNLCLPWIILDKFLEPFLFCFF